MVVGAGWLALLVALLASSGAPPIGTSSDPTDHLVIGVILAMLVAGGLAAFGGRTGADLGWWTILVSSAIVLALEAMQIPIRARSFELEDLAYSATGTIGGSLAAVAMSRTVGERAVVAVVTVVGAIGLAVGVGSVVVGEDDEIEARVEHRRRSCGDGPAAAPDWRRVTVTFTGDDRCIATTVGPMVDFSGGVRLEDGWVEFTGGGLTSGELAGLRDAVSEARELTFGVRVRLEEPDRVDTRPVMIGQLLVGRHANRPLAQILQRGRHLTVAVGSGQPVVGIGLGMADTVTEGVHEIVVTYADGAAAAYLDGERAATGTTSPFDYRIDDEVTLTLGRRGDGGLSRFEGGIEAVLIAADRLDEGAAAPAIGP